MDETLVNITPVWYRRIFENKDLFHPHTQKLLEYSEYEILFRKEYWFNDWLFSSVKDKLELERIEKIYKSFYLEPGFYDSCELTHFGQSVKILALQDFGEIHVVSHTYPEQEDEKRRFIYERIGRKVKFIPLEFNTKKSEYIKNINYDTVADDNPYYLMDIIENTDSFGKEFMIPALGYNSDLLESANFIQLASSNAINLIPYHNVWTCLDPFKHWEDAGVS
jgi:hypothetical protein